MTHFHTTRTQRILFPFYVRFNSEKCPKLVGNLCGIHDVRPFFCRLFPFHFYIDKDDVVVSMQRCPGTGHGEKITEATVKRLIEDIEQYYGKGFFDKIIHIYRENYQDSVDFIAGTHTSMDTVEYYFETMIRDVMKNLSDREPLTSTLEKAAISMEHNAIARIDSPFQSIDKEFIDYLKPDYSINISSRFWIIDLSKKKKILSKPLSHHDKEKLGEYALELVRRRGSLNIIKYGIQKSARILIDILRNVEAQDMDTDTAINNIDVFEGYYVDILTKRSPQFPKTYISFPQIPY